MDVSQRVGTVEIDITGWEVYDSSPSEDTLDTRFESASTEAMRASELDRLDPHRTYWIED